MSTSRARGSLRAYLSMGGIRRFLDLLLIPIVGFICAVRVWNLFRLNLYPFIIAAVLIYSLKNIFLDDAKTTPLHFDLMDASLCIVVLAEIVSFFTSTYQTNSFSYLLNVLFLFLFYYLVKLNLTGDKQKTIIFWLIALLTLSLTGVAFYSVWIQAQELQSLGFTDPTNFKTVGSMKVLFYFFLANPGLMPPGELITGLLMWLPFPLLLFYRYRNGGWWKYLLLLPVVGFLVSIAATFSRGLYIATFAFFLIGSALFLFYRVISWRKLLLFNAGVGITAVILVVSLNPLREASWNTLWLFKNSSQGRSFEGRKSLWVNSVKMFQERPWTGIGAQNFPMHYVPYSSSEGAAYVGRPMNYLLQLLVEKGIAGTLAYGFAFVAFIAVSHKRLVRSRGDSFRRATIILFMTAYVSIIIRDLSYSSILSNEGVTTLLWLMFANNSQSEGQAHSTCTQI